MMTPLISLQNLSLSHPHKVIFKNVNFNLNEGDKVGVLGLNGHGKSSLFKVIGGLVVVDSTVPPFIYDRAKDFSFFYVPQELSVLSDASVESFFFEFYPELKKLKIKLDEINGKISGKNSHDENLIIEQGNIYDELNKLEFDKIFSQYLSYLKYFGMEGLERKVSSLSGGEQRKIALSLGLSSPAKLILWDEPTNHLDLETIQKFEEELQASKKTFMIISHDRSLLNNVVDRIIHIRQGKLNSFKGTYEEYLCFLQEEQKQKQLEIDKLSNFHRRETAWIRRGVQARRTKSKKRKEDFETLTSRIHELKSLAHKSVQLNLKTSGRKTKILIEAENLALSFGERSLFSKLNFTISRGDKIALLGNNGVGKSSLLKLILGEIPATSGSIKRALELDIGHFSQKRESLNNDDTPWKLIGEGIDFVISNSGEKRHVASYLENFLFKSEEITRPIHTFSGGEKNRLQLAQFMKHSRDIWIFDEPTNDLDLETIGILEDELSRYEGALILVGHDRSFIQNVAQKCWVLHDEELHQFEGGFSQAEMFLESLALEEQLRDKSPESITDAVKSAPSPKMTNKEKKRYLDIPHEIEQQEMAIEDLKQSLVTFDYTSMDKEKKDTLTQLESKLKKTEETLEALYEEWANLEHKL